MDNAGINILRCGFWLNFRLTNRTGKQRMNVGLGTTAVKVGASFSKNFTHETKLWIVVDKRRTSSVKKRKIIMASELQMRCCGSSDGAAWLAADWFGGNRYFRTLHFPPSHNRSLSGFFIDVCPIHYVHHLGKIWNRSVRNWVRNLEWL